MPSYPHNAAIRVTRFSLHDMTNCKASRLAAHEMNADLDVTRDDYLKARANFALDWARDRMREDFGLYCHESCKFVHILEMDSETDPG